MLTDLFAAVIQKDNSIMARRCLAMLALSSLSAAQNPWVNRRKNKDKDAPVAADPAAGDTDFSKLNDMVKISNKRARDGAGGADMFAGMGDMWESLMDLPRDGGDARQSGIT